MWRPSLQARRRVCWASNVLPTPVSAVKSTSSPGRNPPVRPVQLVNVGENPYTLRGIEFLQEARRGFAIAGASVPVSFDIPRDGRKPLGASLEDFIFSRSEGIFTDLSGRMYQDAPYGASFDDSRGTFLSAMSGTKDFRAITDSGVTFRTSGPSWYFYSCSKNSRRRNPDLSGYRSVEARAWHRLTGTARTIQNLLG